MAIDAAAMELLQKGVLVEFEVASHEIQEGSDPGEFTVVVNLRFPIDEESDETDMSWGAFGFLYAVGASSFADARSREASTIDYIENDDFQIADLVPCLRWTLRGDLRFDADYVRGRRMKTEIVLRKDGTGRITTTGRGKGPLFWIDRIKGKKKLALV